ETGCNARLSARAEHVLGGALGRFPLFRSLACSASQCGAAAAFVGASVCYRAGTVSLGTRRLDRHIPCALSPSLTPLSSEPAFGRPLMSMGVQTIMVEKLEINAAWFTTI